MNDLESNDLKLNSLEIFGSESNEFEYYGFTRIMLLVVMISLLVPNKFTYQFATNCALAVMISFESTRFLYKDSFEIIVKQYIKNNNCSRTYFNMLDFLVHILPVIYMLFIYPEFYKIKYNISIRNSLFVSFCSSSFHMSWALFTCGTYKLDKIYLPNNIFIQKNIWINLWILAFIGHYFNTLLLFKNIYYIYNPGVAQLAERSTVEVV
jgi:hypothetical protein